MWYNLSSTRWHLVGGVTPSTESMIPFITPVNLVRDHFVWLYYILCLLYTAIHMPSCSIWTASSARECLSPLFWNPLMTPLAVVRWMISLISIVSSRISFTRKERTTDDIDMIDDPQMMMNGGDVWRWHMMTPHISCCKNVNITVNVVSPLNFSRCL